jgi:RNA polymerase sigma-70 factor (ECF subfamily)
MHADAVDGLIVEHQHRLFRYLLMVTGNRAVAEDLFQETWLRVLERGYQYRPEWKFEVWLLSVARHLMIDASRRKKGLSLEGLMDPEAGTGFEPVAVGPSPLETVMVGEAGERLARLLGRIPAAHREVLTLRFQEELSLEEIAAIVRAPLSTVKSRLYRGLEALRTLMEMDTR